ncbi:MAG: hypothetical protein QXF15_02185 [Candidatus Aenigmatarchaeota archaeon]|nr:hypothetical protein [Candidatus Aenigmarchaeota archaeon]
MKKIKRISLIKQIAKERIEILKKRVSETNDPLLKRRYEELIKKLQKYAKLKRI